MLQTPTLNTSPDKLPVLCTIYSNRNRSENFLVNKEPLFL
jgi:hypothetical protein